jgi:hypothetical protein
VVSLLEAPRKLMQLAGVGQSTAGEITLFGVTDTVVRFQFLSSMQRCSYTRPAPGWLTSGRQHFSRCYSSVVRFALFRHGQSLPLVSLVRDQATIHRGKALFSG